MLGLSVKLARSIEGASVPIVMKDGAAIPWLTGATEITPEQRFGRLFREMQADEGPEDLGTPTEFFRRAVADEPGPYYSHPGPRMLEMAEDVLSSPFVVVPVGAIGATAATVLAASMLAEHVPKLTEDLATGRREVQGDDR